ncbi:MAG: zinc-ribbon domain-containing protein [Lachnospiraceae bacterium]|nr:zinc-ribbon domain-containing protein [Lachnospiraceae bacterium]
MYCAHCGTEITEGIRFCPNCGQPQGAPEPEQNYQPYQEAPQPQEYQSQGYQPQGYQSQGYNGGYQSQGYQGSQYAGGTQSNGMAIAGLILGIAALIFTFIFSPVGLILAIIGMVLSAKGRKIEYMRGMATAGWVLSIIALILNIIAIIVMVILLVAGASLIGGLLGSVF